MDFKNLEFFVNSLKGYDNGLFCATNSININWKKDNQKSDYFFWIDPPWRIICNNKIIQNSYNYPYHQNYNEEDIYDQEQEKKDFNKWCEQSDILREKKVLKIEINAIGDLKIIWEDGYELDAFVNDSEDISYYFYDYVSWNRYGIIPGEIITEKMEQNER